MYADVDSPVLPPRAASQRAPSALLLAGRYDQEVNRGLQALTNYGADLYQNALAKA